MNDGGLRAAIAQMEAWIADPHWEPDPEALSQWNAGFQASLTLAKQSEGWPELAARAHDLGRKLEARMVPLVALRDGVRAELDAIECGSRALKGYSANLR